MAELYSDYIIYVDESGDHSLESINPQYPLFLLAFCVFRKDEYMNYSPRVQQLKFHHFGHDMVVLHEHEIRKASGSFRFLVNEERRNVFMSDIEELVREAPFVLIVSAILKERLKSRYAYPTYISD